MTHSPRPWTEGEWTLRPDELIDGDWIVGVNGNEVIEICNASEADARVMVAAPDMAEALADAERTLRAIAESDAWAAPIAPIKKRDADDENVRDERINVLLSAAETAANRARAALSKAGAMEGGGA